ncbi:MAG TPA: serine/threonine-protein kinase, partial [Kofleriaceae bacterium]|nr:serine/threonine-protein kinase [Kofleriaceae bacterium]
MTQDPRIGSVLQERYRVVERLAVGGMGVVYRGERIGLERPVAIKFLRTGVGKKEHLGRFEREARAMSRLAHPACVPVIDYGVDGDAPYIVLEFVDGPALDEILADGPLAPARAVALVRQILAGLAHAHEQGVIHRDMKPGNVIVSPIAGAGEQARIVDFGLAKLAEPSATASWSTASIAVGTPGYMSPEQARGEEVDRRTDLYSTGILLFELLAGRKPFVAEEPIEVLRMHLEQPPPTLAEAAPDRRFSRELQAVIDGALAKDPDRRWQTAVAFSEKLAATPEGQTGATGSEPIVVESSLPPRDRRDPVIERLPTPAPPPRPRSPRLGIFFGALTT